MDNSRGELDRLIDGALAGYGDTEPLAGLEQRVVNRVRVVRQRRRLAWGVGAAVAAGVVVLLGTVNWGGQKPVVRKTPAAVAGVAPQVVPRPAVAASRHRAGVRVKRASGPRALPKLEQFPTPTLLTAEERVLVAFVQRDPQAARQIFDDLEKRTEEPIDIQPIKIAPLQRDSE